MSKTWKRSAKSAMLWVARYAGGFRIASQSSWRSERLLILCYHGISLRDEHEWRPGLYMSQQTFVRRMQLLSMSGYNVLPLAEAFERLANKDLPPRSIVITFDDGFHDFYKLAYPVLKQFGLPATVYVTTYYAGRPIPVFDLILSYLLWKKRGELLEVPDWGPLDLRTTAGLRACWERFKRDAQEKRLSVAEQDALAAGLASVIGEAYSQIRASRMFQIMSPDEIAAVSAGGIDIQLHTHRHRARRDRTLFVRELDDNRRRIHEITGRTADHFCYPSGIYAPEFLPWLSESGIKSATTCELGMADGETSPLLLPRLLDAQNISEVEFESWTSGFRPRLWQKAAHWNPSCW